MGRPSRRDDNLHRTRNVACALALLVLISEMAQIGNATTPSAWFPFSRLALAGIAAVLAWTAWRRTAYWWDVIVLPVLMVAVGAGLQDPPVVIGLVIAVLAHQSPFGSFRVWLVRTVLGVAAIPGSVGIARHYQGETLGWHTASIVYALPQVLMMCVLTRALYVAMLRQATAKAVDAVLARSSQQMLAAADVPAVQAIGARAAEELIALTPGLVLVVARMHGDDLRIVASVGLDEQIIGRVLPRSAIEDAAGNLAPRLKHWVVEPLDGDRYTFLGHRHPLPEELLDAFRTLKHQIVLAETSRISHQELDHQANHDHLTQLPTRAKFFRALAAAVDEGRPGAVALLSIDLDNFKLVNDTYGHAAGDELLVEVARRIAVAGSGTGLGGRFGGDEFALLLTGLGDPADAEVVAGQLCSNLIEPAVLTAATVTVGASIGLAVLDRGVTAAELTRQADIAMYSAKARGKNRVEVFSQASHGEVARHRKLEDQLPYAISRGEIAIYFQPYLSLRTGQWAGVEGLAEWQHPTLGRLKCRELLALAGRTGNLAGITAHVLRTVAGKLAAAPAGAGLQLGLNVGAHQLLDPAFTDSVLATLAECGLPAHRLTLEIIESEQLDEPAARAQLHRLTGGGVRVALDDFGTGYVSLASLRSFPIHQLKVDGSFLTGDPAALDLVLSVGALLGTETVVLGVTTPEQLSRLRATTATAVQGDLLCPIIPAADLESVLRAPSRA